VTFPNLPAGRASDYGGFLSVPIRSNGPLIRDLRSSVYGFDGSLIAAAPNLAALFGQQTLHHELSRPLLAGRYNVIADGLIGDQPRSCPREGAGDDGVSVAARPPLRSTKLGPGLRRAALLVAAGAAGGLLAAAPAATAGCPRELPLRVQTPTSNATALQRVGVVRVTSGAGARLGQLHVVLKRVRRTIAQGSHPQALSGTAPVRLAFRRKARPGRVSLVVSGRLRRQALDQAHATARWARPADRRDRHGP
jgi:hypothetical protein